jgi:hypothetical protein
MKTPAPLFRFTCSLAASCLALAIPLVQASEYYVAYFGPVTVDTRSQDQSVLPGLILSESFEYPVGAIPAPYAGGGQIQSGSLQFQDSNGKTMSARGNHFTTSANPIQGAYLPLNTNGIPPGFLDANGQYGTDGSVIYIAFLASLASGDNQGFGGISLFDREGYTDPLFIGDPNLDPPTDATRWGMDLVSGETEVYQGPYPVDGITRLIVARINFMPGDEMVRLYLDPPLNAEPTTPTLGPVSRPDFRFDSIRIQSGYFQGTHNFDEIKIGFTWKDVVGIAATSTNQAPVFTQQPQNQAMIRGQTATFSVAVTGSDPLTMQWYHNGFALNGATNSMLKLISVSELDEGSYAVRASNQSGWVMSESAECVVWAPPVILSQTASPLRMNAGETLTLSVEAVGTAPLSYAWYFDDRQIVGATAANLVMPNVQPTQQGQFYAVVNNFIGTVTSAVVSVTAISLPAITTEPISQRITPAQMAQGVTFNLGANGTGPFAYQWQLNGQAIAGATNEILTVQPVHLAEAGTYTVVVVNEAGTVVSDPAELVIEVPVILAGDNLTNRVNLPEVMTNVIAGSNTLATVEPGEPAHAGKPTSHTVWYGWTAPTSGWVEFRTRGSSFDTVLAGYGVPAGAGTNSPFNFTLLQALAADDDSGGYVQRGDDQYVDEGTYFSSRIAFNVQGGQDYAVVVASFGETSGRYLLEWEYRAAVAGLPVLLTQPQDQTVPEGGTVHLAVVATNAIEYQWYFNDQPIIHATNAEWVINPASAAVVGVYRVVVIGLGGTVLSAPAEVEIGMQAEVKSYDKWEELEWVVSGSGAGARWAQGMGGSGMLLVSEGYSGQQIIGTYKSTTEPGELAGALEIVTGSKFLALKMEASGTLLVRTGPEVMLNFYPLGVQTSVIRSPGTLRYDGVAVGQIHQLGIATKNQSSVTLDFWVGTAPVASGGQASWMTVPRGGTLELNAPVWSGQPTVVYQWYLEGRILPGENQSRLVRGGVSAAEAGLYSVGQGNVFGSVMSQVARVDVEVPLIMKRGVKWQGTNVVLGFEGNAGQAYQVQRSESLTHWTGSGEVWMVAGGVEYADGEIAGKSQTIYRVKEQGVSCVALTNGYAGGQRVWEVRGGRMGRPYRLESSVDGQSWNFAGVNTVQPLPYTFQGPTNQVYRVIEIP